MNIVSINTALKTNSIPTHYLDRHTIYVAINTLEIEKLAPYITDSAQVIPYNTDEELLERMTQLDLPVHTTRIFCVSEDHLLTALN